MIVNPLFDRVLVLPMDDIGMVKGSLLIPEIARNSSTFGYGSVVAVGPGRHDGQGVLIKPKIKEGAIVMYPRKVGLVIPIPTPEGPEVDHLLFREPEIFATVTDLPKQSSLVDAEGKKLISMVVTSMARPDVAYENIEKTDIAKRDGWIDINGDGSTDHVDETH